MKFTEDYADSQYIIRGYGDDSLEINDQVHTRSLIISPQQLITDWPPLQVDELQLHHFDPILSLAPEVVIIATGPRLKFPDPEVYYALGQHNLAVEYMDTGAACRTYNVLISEYRKVVAGFLLGA